MSARLWLSAGVLLVVCFWLYNVKHHRAEVRAQQAQQAAAADPATAASQSEPEPNPQRNASPVVHGLPTSKDTGDLAMEWNVWVMDERITEHGDASQIEGRLPGLTAERQKIADMSMHDACAQATQEAEVSSMDADIVYFKAKMDDFNTHTFESQDERDAAQRAKDAADNADHMAMQCVTP
ncbi:hypothetical protein GCM10007862_17460 [Dyella lipolytica]|uniref:Secreted protein n=1 Tax=Dyella lipolytica TaxID=1867835 RepID=A0ABW8ISW7_9GAMM|nr:hypothetical protein [Dyella lipolytica]GLQ46695.1 hypothetical protein GCM10007862_17460 [Dyella lipolytica]